MKHKFELGDIVFYPGAELNQATIMKGVITAIIIHNPEGEMEIAYRTGLTYGVPERDCFKTFEPARKRLIQIIKEKEKEMKAEVKTVSKQVKDAKPEDITQVDPSLVEHQSIEEDENEVTE